LHVVLKTEPYSTWHSILYLFTSHFPSSHVQLHMHMFRYLLLWYSLSFKGLFCHACHASCSKRYPFWILFQRYHYQPLINITVKMNGAIRIHFAASVKLFQIYLYRPISRWKLRIREPLGFEHVGMKNCSNPKRENEKGSNSKKVLW